MTATVADATSSLSFLRMLTFFLGMTFLPGDSLGRLAIGLRASGGVLCGFCID